jgi:hypothetical protein
METKTPYAGDTESRNAEERKQVPQGHEEGPKLSQQEEGKQQFRLLVKGLIDHYNADSALEEAEVITMARVLWLKRSQRELSSDTRRLDQDMSGALRRLAKSKAIRRAHELRRTHRKNPNSALIRRGPQTRTHAQRIREKLHLLEPPTGEHDLANGLSPADSEEAKERRRRDRIAVLSLRSTEGKLTQEEEFELYTLGTREDRWHPARIEDHPLYESVQAWRRVVEEGKQADLLRARVRKTEPLP